MFSRLSRGFSLIKSQVLREMISETWSQNDLERTWNRKSFQNGQPGSWVRRERTRSYYLNKVLNISLHVSAVSLYSNFLYHAKDRTAAETKKKVEVLWIFNRGSKKSLNIFLANFTSTFLRWLNFAQLNCVSKMILGKSRETLQFAVCLQ